MVEGWLISFWPRITWPFSSSQPRIYWFSYVTIAGKMRDSFGIPLTLAYRKMAASILLKKVLYVNNVELDKGPQYIYVQTRLPTAPAKKKLPIDPFLKEKHASRLSICP
mmetsp:Transcript_24055/g.38679  ORF Transcript_24055/g.38679 Transcript_24055/m.38679 type:complete len:109 (-) Transcript_24055:2083-2409(-)